MKKKQLSSNMEKIKEFMGDSRKRAILFFAFYFVFFSILIVMVRTAPVKEENKEKPNDTKLEENQEKEVNYQFIYTIEEENRLTIYEGKAYHNKESFTEMKDGIISSYYKLGEHYFKKNEERYDTVTNPYLYAPFLDLKELDSLLSKKDGKTSGNKTTYLVSVIDLLELYDTSFPYDGFTISTIEDDTIEVEKENKRIKKVVYSLNHMIDYYTKEREQPISSLKITLEFTDFDKVEDFDIRSE